MTAIENYIIVHCAVRRGPKWQIQCPLGFATLDKAAALGLATSRAVTDLRQYINSDLGYSDLKFLHLYCEEIATVNAFEGR